MFNKKQVIWLVCGAFVLILVTVILTASYCWGFDPQVVALSLFYLALWASGYTPACH